MRDGAKAAFKYNLVGIEQASSVKRGLTELVLNSSQPPHSLRGQATYARLVFEKEPTEGEGERELSED